MSFSNTDVLAVKLDHIGDFALAVPTLRAIADVIRPGALDVLCSPWNVGWREVLPWVRDFFVCKLPYRQRPGWLPKMTQIGMLASAVWASRQFIGRRYGVAIDLRTYRNHWAGGVPCFLSRAPIRVGSGGTGSRLLTLVDPGSSGHESDRIF